MRWFKSITTDAPDFVKAIEELGKHGAFDIMIALDQANLHKVEQLDVNLISKWCKLKKDRAAKILPHAQEILIKVGQISVKSQSNPIDFDPSNVDGSIKEGKGNRNIPPRSLSGSSPPRATRKTKIPEDFVPTEGMLTWAREKFPEIDTSEETEKFKCHYKAHGTPMKDWKACWESWIRKAKSFSRASYAPKQTRMPVETNHQTGIQTI